MRRKKGLCYVLTFMMVFSTLWTISFAGSKNVVLAQVVRTTGGALDITTIPTIHLAGDSTVKTYTDEEYIGGWGEFLQYYLDENEVEVRNYAHGGRSGRSFINEGRLIDNGQFTTSMAPVGQGPISSQIQAGDYLIIQFGHNDDDSKGYTTLYDRMVPLGTPNAQGVYPVVEGVKTATTTLPQVYLEALEEDTSLTEADREAAITKALKAIKAYGDEYYAYDCGGTYKWFLKQYIDFARENGATPILVTPVARRYFNGAGAINSQPGHHGGSDAYCDFTYVEAVRQLAKEEDVMLIDLFAESVVIYEGLGSVNSKYLQTLKKQAGIWPEEFNACMTHEKDYDFDGTHQNKFGSYLFAAKITEGLKALAQSNGSYGVKGENLKAIHKAFRTKPTTYVQEPEELTDLLSQIATYYKTVEPILIDEEGSEDDSEEDNTEEGSEDDSEEDQTDDDSKNEGVSSSKKASSSKRKAKNTGVVVAQVVAKQEAKQEATQKTTNFKDLNQVRWAQEAIDHLVAAGIFKGVSETEFKPNAQITGKEMKLLVGRFLEFEAQGNVTNELPIYNERATTLINEVTTNLERSMTRQEVMYLVAALLKETGLELSGDEAILKTYKDAQSIPASTKTAIATLIQNGIIKGTGEKLEPNGAITRAQTAVILERVYHLIQK